MSEYKVKVNSKIFRGGDYIEECGEKISKHERNQYSKFFNEWRDVEIAEYENKLYKIKRDSYNGIVLLVEVKEI